MTDLQRHDRDDEQPAENPPIDESTYGGSAAETGGLYDDEGATTANPAGDPMSEDEEDNEAAPGPGDVYRSGS